MPPQETGKQRAARIPLDYYTHADSLERWKVRLGAIALLATLAWTGTHFALSEQRDFQASRGPVAAVHQAWGAQCNACHVDFTPISSKSWAPPFLHHDLKASSQRCQTCHAGPEHHTGQTPDLTCASCHRDHRGPEASLVNLPDSDCTQCHKDLSKHMDVNKAWYLQNGGKEFKKEVTQFSAHAHPMFRSIEKDPGKLKFNHQRHLTAGIPIIGANGEKGGALKTLGDLPEPYKTRYRKQQENKADSAPVQLQCASCHQLESGDFSVPGQRNAGAYMLPITYENQCQACHPLTVEKKALGDPKLGDLAIPHRWQPKEIHEYLENFFTGQLARGQAGFLEKKLTRPLPGKLPEILDPKVAAAIEENLERTEIDLYTSARLCAECHYFEGKSIPEAIQSGKAPDLRIMPPRVPLVWFQQAKFNHTAHRAVQCADCHDKAATSKVHTDVLIPDRDNCVQCHAPTIRPGMPGARFNCTECHLYHNRRINNDEHFLQGVGAAKRNPEKVQTIKDFLRVK